MIALYDMRYVDNTIFFFTTYNFSLLFTFPYFFFTPFLFSYLTIFLFSFRFPFFARWPVHI